MRAPLPALFGLALGLTFSACAGDDSDDDAATTTAATEDAGATAMTLGASTTITQPPETVDAGGETYGGPEWDTDTFGTTADGGAATVATDTDADADTSTTSDPGTDTEDAGGETYGGPEWDTDTEGNGSTTEGSGTSSGSGDPPPPN